MYFSYAQQTHEPHPHQYDAHAYAAGKFLLVSLVMSMTSVRQLLILSGDVEMNPGPLGQHGEGIAAH